MARFNISDLRTKVPEILEIAKTEAVEIEKHGKSTLVILDAMKYEQLLEHLEDVEDNLAYLEYKLNPKQEFEDWALVKADLGLN
jgi:antitoxin Phd